ncbi:MAG: hypothetical protein H0X35_11590 [Pseudonocardiales bacterium]|nr:hypothetical protein [Pseudonocardiales bacterium]
MFSTRNSDGASALASPADAVRYRDERDTLRNQLAAAQAARAHAEEELFGANAECQQLAAENGVLREERDNALLERDCALSVADLLALATAATPTTPPQ